MAKTLEERKKEAAEKAEDEWKKEQEGNLKREIKETKLAEIRNTKLDLPKPEKTGWAVINELFEAVVGEETASCVQWAVISGDYLGIFRAVKSGIIASFTGVPIPKELKVAPLSESVRDEFVDFVTKHPKKDEESDFTVLYGSPLLAGGCLSQTWILREKFSLPLHQIPVFKIRNDEVDKIFRPGHFTGFACGVVDSTSFQDGVIAADKQFTHKLATSNFYAKPVYSLTTPLLQLNLAISDNVSNRQRDRSMVLKKLYGYRTRELTLNIGDFTEQAEVARRMEEAVEEKWKDLRELFAYWEILNKELDKLDSLYRQTEKE